MKKAIYWLAPVLLLGLVSCQSKSPEETSSVQAAGKDSSVWSRIAPKSTYNLPAGTALDVRLDQSLDTSRNLAGDTFTATLEAPVMKGQKVILPKGTRFTGHVMSAKPSGRLKGRGYLTATLDSFDLDGKSYQVSTSATTRVTGNHKKRNTALIGGGAGVGALVGAIAGGGKGAAIGAAAGAGAGTAGAAATGEKNVTIPAESVLTFSLKAPVTVKG